MQGLIATVTYETKHPSEENLSEVWRAEILNYRVWRDFPLQIFWSDERGGGDLWRSLIFEDHDRPPRLKEGGGHGEIWKWSRPGIVAGSTRWRYISCDRDHSSWGVIPDFLKSCRCTSDMETAKITIILQELRSDYERHFSGEQEKESSLNLYFKVIQLHLHRLPHSLLLGDQ